MRDSSVLPDGGLGQENVESWLRADHDGISKSQCCGRSTVATSSPGLTGPGVRLRKRGVLASMLRHSAKEVGLTAGGDTSQFLSHLWCNTLHADGAKVISNHRVPYGEKDAQNKHSQSECVLTIRLDGVELAVGLSIYVKLYAYACFRPRTSDMVASLRSRAAQYSKELGIPQALLSWVLPGTISLALQVLRHEGVGFEAIAGYPGKVSDKQTGRLVKAQVPELHIRKAAIQCVPLPILAGPLGGYRVTKEVRLEGGGFTNWLVRAIAGGSYRYRPGRTLPAPAR